MKVITSRFWKRCDAPHCIILTNKKAWDLYTHWYLCAEHLSEERVQELDERDLELDREALKRWTRVG